MGITHTHNSTFPSSCPGKNGARWRASFEMHPMAQGDKYVIFRAKMFQIGTGFYLTEQKSVVKVVKSHVANEEDWVFYLQCLTDAKKYSRNFSKFLTCHDSTERLAFAIACTAAMDSVSQITTSSQMIQRYKKRLSADECVLIESNIRGKLKPFISVIGKSLRDDIEVLEAFCHFTYWESGGELVVCDLKGTRKGDIYRLTAPCIHSKTKQYGPGDMGEDGIILFLETHVCNRICKDWARKHTNVSPLPSTFQERATCAEQVESLTAVEQSMYPSMEL